MRWDLQECWEPLCGPATDKASKEQSQPVPVPRRRRHPEAPSCRRPPPMAHPLPEFLFTGGRLPANVLSTLMLSESASNRHKMGFIQVVSRGGWGTFHAHTFTALCSDISGTLVTSVLLSGSDRQSPLCSHRAGPPGAGSRQTPRCAASTRARRRPETLGRLSGGTGHALAH